MALKQELNTLLNKKMDRKDFLKHVGIAVIAATGVGAVVKTLANSDSSKVSQQSAGYGGSVYGGHKDG
jgi:hypothetical protein